MTKQERKKWKRKLRPVDSSRQHYIRDQNGNVVPEPKGYKGIEYSISSDGWCRSVMIQDARRKG